jgi:large subunit ribosomal protein L10
MNRQEKERVVQGLRKNFADSPASFVVQYKGLTVNQLQDLRSQLRKSGGSLKVTKARLMKIAVEDVENAKQLLPYFKNQIGVVFAQGETPAIAKILGDFEKNHEAFQLIAGQLDAELLTADSIKRIATLPSKEVLLAQLCGTLNAPIVNIASLLNMHIIRLLLVLKQISEKEQ